MTDLMTLAMDGRQRMFRCVMCGGMNVPYEELWSEGMDDEIPIGAICLECDYWEDGSGDKCDTAEFFMPGDPGSHDQLSDYEPPKSQAGSVR